MQNDPHRAIALTHEPPGFIHRGHLARCIGEAHIAHGGGVAATELDHMVANLTTAPGLDGKPLVLGEGRIATHEIGDGSSPGGPERLSTGGKRGLEGHRPVLIGIGLIDHRFRRDLGLGIPARAVGGTDVEQPLAPAPLGRHHLSLRDVAVEHLHGWCRLERPGQPHQQHRQPPHQTTTGHRDGADRDLTMTNSTPKRK